MTLRKSIDIGEFAEGLGWELHTDWEIGDAFPCPHTKDGKVPRVVVAFNEGGFNRTELCVDCILEALNALLS